jgi:hypothetical protein
MDGDGAGDSSYACESIESSDAGFDGDYSESESEYFDASSEEHSSYSDYSSDGGHAKLVEPIGEDRDGEASDPDAEEGTTISEGATGKTNKFERFPGLSRTRISLGRFGHRLHKDSRTDIKITTSDSPTLSEALSSTPIEQELWQQSIAEEMESLQAKGTWVDVDVATCPPLPTHPVLQIKRTVNGEFERCKTRIVAGGDHQEYGVNYTDTYAPVIEWTIVRLFYICRVFSPGKKYKLLSRLLFATENWMRKCMYGHLVESLVGILELSVY